MGSPISLRSIGPYPVGGVSSFIQLFERTPYGAVGHLGPRPDNVSWTTS
jgi:hypothetical protein